MFLELNNSARQGRPGGDGRQAAPRSRPPDGFQQDYEGRRPKFGQGQQRQGQGQEFGHSQGQGGQGQGQGHGYSQSHDQGYSQGYGKGREQSQQGRMRPEVQMFMNMFNSPEYAQMLAHPPHQPNKYKRDFREAEHQRPEKDRAIRGAEKGDRPERVRPEPRDRQRKFQQREYNSRGQNQEEFRGRGRGRGKGRGRQRTVRRGRGSRPVQQIQREQSQSRSESANSGMESQSSNQREQLKERLLQKRRKEEELRVKEEKSASELEVDRDDLEEDQANDSYSADAEGEGEAQAQNQAEVEVEEQQNAASQPLNNKFSQSMCPESDFKQRLDMHSKLAEASQQQGGEFFQIFQLNKSTKKPDRKLAVKVYIRPSPSHIEEDGRNVRSPSCLLETIRHLVLQVGDADQIDPKTVRYHHQQVSFQRIYQFMWNRCKGITKDLTMLGKLIAADAIQAAQLVARFFVLSFNEARPFDEKLSMEPLKNALDWLENCYCVANGEVLVQLSKHGLQKVVEGLDKGSLAFSSRQAEMLSYLLILAAQGQLDFQKKLSSNLQLQQGPVNQLRESFLRSAHIENAFKLVKAIKSSNFVRYFKLLDDPRVDYLTACCALYHLKKMRVTALRITLSLHRDKEKPIPVAFLLKNLGFSTRQLPEFNLLMTDCGLIDKQLALSDGYNPTREFANPDNYRPQPFDFKQPRRANPNRLEDVVKLRSKGTLSRAYFILQQDQAKSSETLRQTFRVEAPIRNKEAKIRTLLEVVRSCRRRLVLRTRALAKVLQKKVLRTGLKAIRAYQEKPAARQEMSFMESGEQQPTAMPNFLLFLCRLMATYHCQQPYEQVSVKLLVFSPLANQKQRAMASTLMDFLSMQRTRRDFKKYVDSPELLFTLKLNLEYQGAGRVRNVAYELTFVRTLGKLVTQEVLSGTDLIFFLLDKDSEFGPFCHKFSELALPRNFYLLILYHESGVQTLKRECKGLTGAGFREMFAVSYENSLRVDSIDSFMTTPMAGYIIFALKNKTLVPSFGQVSLKEVAERVAAQLEELAFAPDYCKLNSEQKYRLAARLVQECVKQLNKFHELGEQMAWFITSPLEPTKSAEMLLLPAAWPESKEEALSMLLIQAEQFAPLESLVYEGASEHLRQRIVKHEGNWAVILLTYFEIVQEFASQTLSLPKGWQIEVDQTALRAEKHERRSREEEYGQLFDFELLHKIRKRRGKINIFLV